MTKHLVMVERTNSPFTGKNLQLNQGVGSHLLSNH